MTTPQAPPALTDTELVNDLRRLTADLTESGWWDDGKEIATEAADRIASLSAQVEALTKELAAGETDTRLTTDEKDIVQLLIQCGQERTALSAQVEVLREKAIEAAAQIALQQLNPPDFVYGEARTAWNNAAKTILEEILALSRPKEE